MGRSPEPPCRRLPGSLAAVAALAVLGGGCRRPAADAGEGGLFADVTASSGIDFRLVSGAAGERFLPETMLGGLAWLDFDGDGDHDLYLVNGHSDPERAERAGKESDRLYRNDGGGRFTDVTASARVGDRRYGMGAAAGDFDNDGDADLLVANFGRNTLYRNEGDGTFRDITAEAGFIHRGFSTSAVWFDMDRDGDLDLYVVRYVAFVPRLEKGRCRRQGRTIHCSPAGLPGEPDLLYRNLGGGRFEEIGHAAGIARGGPSEGKGLGAVSFDFDRDGFQDVFVANDTTPNQLWRNRGDGTFEDVALERGVALGPQGRPLAGMGIDVADVNADGWSDIHVTNYAGELNSLFLGGPGGHFRDASLASGLEASLAPLGFGCLFLDADLDGRTDLVVLNGHVEDEVEALEKGAGGSYRQRPSLYLGAGDGRLCEAGARGGPCFATPIVGRGLASSDFDGDGDLDLAAVAIDRSLILLENRASADRRALVIQLRGTRSNRDGYGARIDVEVNGVTRAFEYQAARSYLSSCDPRVVVGLGDAAQADRVTVTWPSGTVQTLTGVPAERKTLLIVEPEPLAARP